ncbi:N-acylmannosamine kinase [Oxalobacteraceae bacterium GrIS 2.11]
MKQVIVFDIGGTQSRIALLENNQIIWRDQLATPGQDGPAAMLDVMAQLYQQLSHLDAPVAVAVTGQIVDGCVTAHNPALLPGWDSYPLQQRLSEKLDRTVLIYNDARAAAWGEYRFGTGQGCHEFLFLTVSTGIGAGLILNRRLHLAKNGFDAEIGEMKTEGGITLEDRASGSALNALAIQHGYADAKAFCDAAERGDARANTLYRHGIAEIAKKLADLAVMLGIQRVAVGGSVGLRPGYLQRLETEMNSYPAIYRFELLAARLGHDAGLYGAAALATEQS